MLFLNGKKKATSTKILRSHELTGRTGARETSRCIAYGVHCMNSLNTPACRLVIHNYTSFLRTISRVSESLPGYD